jgi:hypothetical protein
MVVLQVSTPPCACCIGLNYFEPLYLTIRNSQEAQQIRYALDISHVVTGNCVSHPSRCSRSPPKLVPRIGRAHFRSYHPVSPRAEHDPVMVGRLVHDARWYLDILWYDAVAYGAAKLDFVSEAACRASSYAREAE